MKEHTHVMHGMYKVFVPSPYHEWVGHGWLESMSRQNSRLLYIITWFMWTVALTDLQVG